VDVTVTNPDNQAATLPGAFTYYPPLVITSVTGNSSSTPVDFAGQIAWDRLPYGG
jgi:hypothetical protein